jgi:DUF4097 and DUF4098 domain-containing protein YvlB
MKGASHMFRPMTSATAVLAGFVLCGSAWADGSVSTVNGSIHVGSQAPQKSDTEPDQHSVNQSYNLDGSSQHIGNLSTVNGSITIDANQHAGDLTVVNGSIHVSGDAQIGHVSTVNGGVTLGPRTSAAGAGTVNGAIHIGAGSRVAGAVRTVNGALDLDEGTDLSGELATVNGKVRLTAAHVGGGIITVNGDVDVGANSHIDGGIHVETHPQGWFDWFFVPNHRTPKIVIGPGAVVTGKLWMEQEVELYVSDRATIGPVEGAKVISFSGDHPPN